MPADRGLLLAVRAHPGAARPRVEWDGAVAGVWVSAPAADGAANRAVLLAVARWLGVAPSSVVLVRGHRSRSKLVEVTGVSELPAQDARGPAPGSR